ncbi:MAG: methyl-accepting chemotaxis protein [Deltaproteobacteria bacterium]|nr:methyl-accepting chemotaxis protein [Deltaproteobacteria bacterium]
MLDVRLRTRVSLMMILVTSIVIILFALILGFDFTKRYTVALQSEGKAHASSLLREVINEISYGMAFYSIEAMNAKCSEIESDNRNIGYAMITDLKGKIIYHSSATEKGKGRPPVWLEGLIQEGEDKFVVQKSTYLGSRFYDISIPVEDSSNKVLGYVSVGLYEEVVSKALNSAVLISFIIGVLAIGIVAVAAFLFGRAVADPLDRVTVMLKDIAMGEGDLTKRLNITSRDEIGELSHWFDLFMGNTQAMIRKFKNTTSQIYEATMAISSYSSAVSEGAESQHTATENTSSSIDQMKANFSEIATNIDNLSSTTEEASSSILEMAASIDEVANIAEDFSSSVDEVSASVEEMSVTIKEVAGTAEELSVSADSTVASIGQISASIKEVERSAKDSSAVAQDAAADAEKGMAAVEKTIEGMNKIKLSVNESAEIIRKLGEKSSDIGEILTVIDEVAEQTNLLALNAAIIAAQAGEHGKGFAVVSDEIMDLSERTAASTKEISGLIKALQKESDNAVKSMELGLKRVEEGADLSQEAGASLEKILNGSIRSKDMISHIAAATVEQLKGSTQVKEAMENVNNIVMRIAQATYEQSKGSELIVNATEAMKDSTGHVKRATQEQSKGGRQITAAIEKITTMTNFVNRASQEQAQGVSLVVRDIEEIKRLTGEYGTAVSGMHDAVESLISQTEVLGNEIKKFKV